MADENSQNENNKNNDGLESSEKGTEAVYTVFDNSKAEEHDKNIVVFCAHSDDQVIGAGGAIAKYYDEGYNVITVIMSQGEGSHPWLRKEPLAKIRIQESEKAARVLGIRRTIFFGLPEDKIYDSYVEDTRIQDAINNILEDYVPKKIIVHGDEDPHPSHQQVYKVVKEAYLQLKENYPEYGADVYTYDVWTLANFKRKDRKWVYIDITRYFKKKRAALDVFKTQKVAVFTLWLSIYGKALIYGIMSRYKLAERFASISLD